MAADGNASGTIDAGDYDVWKLHFGETTGSGSAGNFAPGESPGANYAVPEPVSLVLLAVGIAATSLRFAGRRA